MARLSFASLVLLSLALIAAPAFAKERKMLQLLNLNGNVPITAQCVNLLDNSQVANIPNLNVALVQAIVQLLSVGGQTPTALFWNTGSAENKCSNDQTFNNYDNCGNAIDATGILGSGKVTPCYGAGGNRKLLQLANLNLNVPITIQCLNILDNSQVLNVPNLNVALIQAIVNLASAGGQTPSALFLNSGSAENKCSNNQEFNNYDNCGNAIDVTQIIGCAGTVTPCYGRAGNRKLQQLANVNVNAPITVQCVNLLDNDQILNLPNVNVALVQAIVNLFSAGGQTPTAVFWNSGSADNKCSNNQEFNNYDNCGNAVDATGILGSGKVTPCYN
jgi:hypothetical protein